MEIQKIYSDPYDEERLYSVLMGEDEIRMFTGAVKRANKVSKKIWQETVGRNAVKTGRTWVKTTNPEELRRIGRTMNPHLSLGGVEASVASMGGGTLNGKINVRGSNAGKYLTTRQKIKGGLTGDRSLHGGIDSGYGQILSEQRTNRLNKLRKKVKF